jgi:hypothetical protein
MPAFASGHCALASANILATHTGDRPSFQADVSRGLFSSGHFQIFALPTGLLFLEMQLKDHGNLGGGSYGTGLAGAAAAWNDAQRYGARPEDSWETGLDALSEDELFELASSRRKSFVSKIDGIRSVSIDQPGFLARTFGFSGVLGTITLRDASLGKVFIDIKEESAMSVAIESLPRRLGPRVQVNLEFDRASRQFVPRR